MPIDLCSSVSSVSQYAFGSSFVNIILSSSIFVAVVIAIIMTLIIMILYPAKKGTPFFLVGKMFVYMFFISWLVIFLHDSVLRYTFDEEKQADSAHDFIENLSKRDCVYGSQHTQVLPTPLSSNDHTPQKPVPDKSANTVSSNTNNTSDNIIGAGTLGGYHPPTTGGNPFV